MSVTEHGNEIVNSPVIYPLWYYNNDWEAPHVRRLAVDMVAFLEALIASGYFNGLQDYGVGTPALGFAVADPAPYLDTHVLQWQTTDAYFQERIEGAITDRIAVGTFPDPPQTDTPGPVFLLFMSPAIECLMKDGRSSYRSTDAGGPFGGYHGWMNSQSASGEENVFYCVVAWPATGGNPRPLPTTNTGQDWTLAVNDLTLYASHELAEAFTERDGDGFRDDQGKEIGDLCEAQRGAQLVAGTTSSPIGWNIERYWRNGIGCWPPGNLGQIAPDPPPPPVVTVLGPMGAVTTADGRTYAFVKSFLDGRLRLNYWDGQQWLWNDQGMPFGHKVGALDAIGVVTVGGSNPVAFVGAGGHLWVNYWDGANWIWSDQGKPGGQPFSGDIAATAVNGADPYAFVRATDGHLWVNYWTGGPWLWRDQGIPPGLSSIGENIAAVTVDSDRPYVFVWGSDGNLWVNYYAAGWKWDKRGTPPGDVGVDGSIAAVAVDGTKPFVFVRASDGTLWTNYWDGLHWHWNPQGAPPGNKLTTADIAAVVVNPNHPRVCVEATDGNLWMNWWDGNNWHWTNHSRPAGKILGTFMAAVTVAGKLPYTFLQASDGHLWVNYPDGAQWPWEDQGEPHA